MGISGTFLLRFPPRLSFLSVWNALTILGPEWSFVTEEDMLCKCFLNASYSFSEPNCSLERAMHEYSRAVLFSISEMSLQITKYSSV